MGPPEQIRPLILIEQTGRSIWINQAMVQFDYQFRQHPCRELRRPNLKSRIVQQRLQPLKSLEPVPPQADLAHREQLLAGQGLIQGSPGCLGLRGRLGIRRLLIAHGGPEGAQGRALQG